MVESELESIIASHTPENHYDGLDARGLLNDIATIMPPPPGFDEDTISPMSPEKIKEKLLEQAEEVYRQREQEFGPELMRELERRILLRTMDTLWIAHLTFMDEKRLEAAGRACGS
jgi:preprotein translocase subunit SecA